MSKCGDCLWGHPRPIRDGRRFPWRRCIKGHRFGESQNCSDHRTWREEYAEYVARHVIGRKPTLCKLCVGEDGE